jgi:GNAT superfamily N-acetyltransferase
MIFTSRQFLEQAIPTGSFRGWLASVEGRIVAGGAVLLSPWPSHTYDGECRRATILNVYTYPEFRRRGIARQLMGTMIDWCRDQGLAVVYLHASPDGRPLYEALGFEPTAEMRFKLR